MEHLGGKTGYKGPMNRYAHVFAYAEPGILLFRWLSLMLHPLKLESPKCLGRWQGVHDKRAPRVKEMWVCLKIVYPYTQWLMIIIPIKWLWLGIHPIFRQTQRAPRVKEMSIDVNKHRFFACGGVTFGDAKCRCSTWHDPRVTVPGVPVRSDEKAEVEVWNGRAQGPCLCSVSMALAESGLERVLVSKSWVMPGKRNQETRKPKDLDEWLVIAGFNMFFLSNRPHVLHSLCFAIISPTGWELPHHCVDDKRVVAVAM